MDLKGKVSLVTGAGRGIGRAICIELAKAGSDIAVNDLNKENGERVVSEVRELGRESAFFRADVSNYGEVINMVSKVLDKFRKIDILVNNAGIASATLVKDMDEKEWDRVLDVNLKGVFNCCKAVLGHMVKRGSGKIINIASSAAFTGDGVISASYSASKAGILGFTKTLARELGPHGINVNAVAPSFIITDMLNELLAGKNIKDYVNLIPMGRAGRPEDVANAVVFLASDRSDWITGQTIHVNGGILMY
jgi:3-oxoacyl-[acyl-carrier protein] reductase